ncbi:MAG: ATP-binding protein [Acidimicrobiia bacterium]|nr:ATP-binding protein [Acidimicrobiia bacterium]
MSDDRLRALALEISEGRFGGEEDWLEWKRELDLNKRLGRFQLSKQILGMANRSPEVAQGNCEGYGYIFIGVEDGSMPGTLPIDPAQLHDGINPYVGATGPSWRPRYLQGNSVVVIVVEVDPPRWGDSIHTLRRGYDNFHAGTIFVRKNGKTHPAEPEDIENLQRRARGSRLDVQFRLAGADQIGWFDRVSLDDAVASISDHQRSSQLARARNHNRQPGASDPFGIMMSLASAQALGMGKERRSLDTFERQVDEWCTEWIESAPQHWIQEYMEAGHGVYVLELANLTDENFSSVQVRIKADKVHIVDEIPSESVRLPEQPIPFGQDIGLPDFRGIVVDPLRFAEFPHSDYPTTIRVTHTDGNAELTWEVGHLRPEETRTSPNICILVDASRVSNQVRIAWTATSTSVNGVMRGVLKRPLSDNPIMFDDIEHDLGL